MRIVAKRKVADMAKVLIVISITLLVYGLILHFTSSYHLIDPIKDVEVVTENDNVISITTSDGSKIIFDNQDSTSDEVQNNNSISNNRVQDDTAINSIDRDNLLLKNKIEKDYSVSVLYGNDTVGYSVSGISTVPITDPLIVNKQLNSLYTTLSLYPEGIFKEIKNGGIPLKIILINNYSEVSVTGITDSSYDYANISIAAMYDFNESFYHESYHYIERYMFKKGANFNSWDSLNPDGFSWDTIDGSLSYSNTFSEDSYFVNNYAQTSDTEDRASTFEYMMAQTRASCMNKNTPVWDKANYIAMIIESTLDSVTPDKVEYWERWVKD